MRCRPLFWNRRLFRNFQRGRRQHLARRSQASKFQPGHQVKSLLRLSSRRLIQKRWQRPLLQWKKTPVRPTITQPEAPELKAPEPTSATPITLSALKAVAIKAPIPDYPYQAKNAHITGSGVCVLLVDTASGRVTSATMAQSTGNEIGDKVTTNTFERWRFKPGTLSQVQVPITYE